MALITCEGASFAYEGRRVIEELQLEIHPGEYLCVVGENGSGKSTLIKGLLGLISPVAGKVCYGEGFDRTQIGYLPQKTDVQNDFPATVQEVVTSGCRGMRPFLTGSMRREALDMMTLLGIETIRKESFRDLSGGQQQRVLLARALCSTRKLLLLDEPVAGLDPVITREMYELVDRLHREMALAVVMISHDICGAIGYADRVLHLQDHRAVFLGTSREYVESPLGISFSGGEHHA